MKYLNDGGAYEYDRARRAAYEAALVDGAFRDILQGRFDSFCVHEALKLGHHQQYPILRERVATATRAARAAT